MTTILQNLIRRIQNLLGKPTGGVVIAERVTEKTIDFGKLFGNQNPVVVEFGVGKGKFIREYASKHAGKNFLGVEKVNKWIKHSAERIEKKKLQNVRLVNSTAEKVLANIQPEAVQEFYILFPDPWPKRRHQFRRVVQKNLIQKIHQSLSDKGKLYIATDHADYFVWMKKVIEPTLGSLFEMTQQRPEFISNYQVKYEKEGRTINAIHLQKL